MSFHVGVDWPVVQSYPSTDVTLSGHKSSSLSEHLSVQIPFEVMLIQKSNVKSHRPPIPDGTMSWWKMKMVYVSLSHWRIVTFEGHNHNRYGGSVGSLFNKKIRQAPVGILYNT